MTAPLRLAVVNQSDEGGAGAAAREVLAWGPARGLEIRWFPETEGEGDGHVLRALREWRPSVVHVHCWYQEYSWRLLHDLGRRHPTVFTVHDVAAVNQYGTECWECWRNAACFGCPALGPVRRWRPNYRVLERWRKRWWNLRTRCHLVYPSEWMRRRLQRSEWSRLPGEVIPYGIDTETFSPGPADRAALGLPPGPLVLFAGNMYSPLDHRKGLPDLFQAWPAVRARVPDAVLAVAGRVVGAEPPAGALLLDEVPRGRLRDLLRAADVFALPSRGDNLPLAGLEAQACGVPVAGTRVGGIPEEILDGVTGLLVPAADPPALALALVALLSDPARRQAMGTAARARAEALFARDVSAAAHESLYRRLAGPIRS